MAAIVPQGPNTATTRSRNKAAVRKVIEAFNTGNTDLIDAVAIPDLRSHTPAPGTTSNRDGLKSQVAWIRDQFPDANFEEQEMVAEGDVVYLRWRMKGTHQKPYLGQPATGRSITHDGIEILRVKNGKIVEHRGNFDTLRFLDKLGLLNDQTLSYLSVIGMRAYTATGRENPPAGGRTRS